MDLTKDEFQQLVLMLGSKKELGTYLGLDAKATDLLWQNQGLKTPLTWLRDQSREAQLELLAKHGSLKKLAAAIGCSDSALRPLYMGDPKRALDWPLDFLLDQFERYRSVRFIAHLHGVNESLVRKEVERHELEIADLIAEALSNRSDADALQRVHGKVRELTRRFPIPF